MILVPAYEIQVDAFIPHEYVPWPGNAAFDALGLTSQEYFYGGDKRKVPLDAVFNAGAQFDETIY